MFFGNSFDVSALVLVILADFVFDPHLVFEVLRDLYVECAGLTLRALLVVLKGEVVDLRAEDEDGDPEGKENHSDHDVECYGAFQGGLEVESSEGLLLKIVQQSLFIAGFGHDFGFLGFLHFITYSTEIYAK